MNLEELRLLYVAVTRAKRNLDISQLPAEKGDKPTLFNRSFRNNDNEQGTNPKMKRPPIEIVAERSLAHPTPQRLGSEPSRERRGIIKRMRGD